jgi:hypothetical protein
MLNAILNGALGETSSRSGSSSSSRSGTSETTYSISTPSGTYTGLTLDQYNQAKYALEKYNEAYGIAYSYDLTAPDWLKFTASNAQSIVDDYAKRAIESGKTSKSESWAAFAAERYAATQPPVTVQETEYYLDTPIAGRIKVSESAYNKYKYASDNWGKYLQYCKDNDVDISVKDLWDMLGENGAQTMVILQNMVESRKTPPEVVIPENVVPTVSVAPSEEKGNSLLIPSIVLSLGVIGAIALTSKSKKRR